VFFKRSQFIIYSILLFGGGCATNAAAVTIVSERPEVICEEFRAAKELRIFKDPAVFLSALNSVTLDPKTAWEAMGEERPLLTTVRGTFHMTQLGPPRRFPNFGAISKAYEISQLGYPDSPAKFSVENDTEIIPIKMCGPSDAYNDSLGFVVLSELVWAQIDENDEGQLPPSTLGNPIPKLKWVPDVAAKEK
jgi:hypothetical protein